MESPVKLLQEYIIRSIEPGKEESDNEKGVEKLYKQIDTCNSM